ncbi:DUF805 domain-containing protein [Ruegeria pomeroyi]|uniref:DUF805 domain-containing protein n=1 Tax=Ruegeria pomeroyi TaxID=89184 RepID=UPI001F385254|nr:DUF805 domain-containing protein [Ruegeria pomeroyi]MCE8509258.1 DUF805 domain-containing protein [Ruegeria pomeroyi]
MTHVLESGFVRSFDGSGRMERRAYWAFFPAALVPPVVFATQVTWFQTELWGIWKLGVLFLLALPLINATRRRLQDTGEDGNSAFYPFMPFVIMWVGYQCILWIGYALALASGGTAFVPVLLIWLLALLVVAPLHIVCLFVSLMITANVMGQLLVASEPGENRYGPNPLESIT